MKDTLDKEIRKQLAKRHTCYVLITCDPADEHGEMNVEMTYEGDPVLAAYLLKGAQSFMEDAEAEKSI